LQKNICVYKKGSVNKQTVNLENYELAATHNNKDIPSKFCSLFFHENRTSKRYERNYEDDRISENTNTKALVLSVKVLLFCSELYWIYIRKRCTGICTILLVAVVVVFVVIEHVGENVLCVLESLGHFCVGAF